MIRRRNGSTFTDCQTIKRYDAATGTWKDATIGKRYDAATGTWINILPVSPEPAPTTYTKIYNVSSIWTYLIQSGSQQSSHLHEPIQGTYDSSTSHSRSSILLFPYATIKTDLAGATVKKAEIYLKRLNDSGQHGQATAYARITAHNYANAPTKWTGADLGNALKSQTDSATSFTRGQARWLELLSSVAEGLKAGTIKGLCVDAGLSTSLQYYIKYASQIQLRITYTK